MTRELSEHAKVMLERAVAEERPLLPGPERRARLKRGLLQGAALAASGPAAAAHLPAKVVAHAGATHAAAGAVSLLPLAKGLAVGLLLSGGALGGAQLLSSSPAPVSAVPAASVTSSAATVAPPLAAPGFLPAAKDDEPPASISPRNGTPAPARSASSASPVTSETPGLAAELELMTAAQAALRDGRGAEALALLERYDRTFASGQLLGERLAAEVFAACQVGNRARAARAARRFEQLDSTSVLAGRVRRSCAFEDGKDEP